MLEDAVPPGGVCVTTGVRVAEQPDEQHIRRLPSSDERVFAFDPGAQTTTRPPGESMACAASETYAGAALCEANAMRKAAGGRGA